MEDHELLVEFDRYCKTCQYEKLKENEPPCDECLRFPVCANSHKPYCYKERS